MASNSMQDPLAQLRDIHVPLSPEWWPPAPGWWLFALIVLALAWAGVSHTWRRYRAGAPLRQAENELERYFSHFDATRDAPNAKRELANAVNAVLKRIALVRFPRNEVAELSGPRWTAFLDASADTEQFSSGMGRVLGDERFSRSFNFDPPALRLAAEHWIEVQRRKPIPGSTSLRERVSRIASISDTWGTSGVGAAGPRSASAGGASGVGAAGPRPASAANHSPRGMQHSRLKPLPQKDPLPGKPLPHPELIQQEDSSDPNQGQAQ